MKTNANEKGGLNRVLSIVFRCLIATALSLVLYYFILPPVNVHSIGFWVFLLAVLAIFVLSVGVFSLKNLEKSFTVMDGNKVVYRKQSDPVVQKGIGYRILLWLTAVPVIVLLVGGIISSTVFNAKGYAEIIQVAEGDFEAEMPQVDKVTNIALMDTDSARILGNRKLGALANVVSQYVASENYSQINYGGKPMKISHLEYDGFFKWLNNNDQGIPGYVMVDPIANTAEYYEMEEGMKYAESGYFSHDLNRALRFSYPTKIFHNISFEVDEEGKAWYVVACATPRVGLFGAMDIDEVILFDPVTGDSSICKVADTPSWVDIVFHGELACQKYDWQGTLSGGFINSIIGNKGCKQTTDDFGYIVLGDDVWYFTGVTSVTSDSSNIGFILSCARTGEYKFYPVIGAEEHSAMGAAEGEVQEKGYVASFPSLVNIGGEPSYIMVLKDEGGLVKLYAVVNVRQYSIVATGENQSAAIAAYTALLAQNGIAEAPPAQTPTVTVAVEWVQSMMMDGKSYLYIAADDQSIYRVEFTLQNEALIALKAGDVLEIAAVKEESGIYRVITWKKK